MRTLRRRIAAAALATSLLGAAAIAAPNPVVIAGDPAAPPLVMPGTGLCGTAAISQNAATDFGTFSAATYNAGINAFIEMHAADRVTSVLGTIFDLSNNNSTGLKLSYGDFTNSMMGCPTGGCPFPWNDTTTSFGARYRGFLNIPPNLAGHVLHIGFYADDAVSLTIYDRAQTAYPVVTRPPELGAPTWRTTNSVTFMNPGLYPVEILYVEIVEHAALEMSLLDGAFTDYELPANSMGSSSLETAGFTLLGVSNFFETDDGQPPFADATVCAQCNRQFANSPGNGGCMPSYYCNEAALCAPCDSALFCGDTCSPCGQSSPFCINVNGKAACYPCRDDNDCQTGRHCDAVKHVCQDCNVDTDCTRGKICNANACVPCATADHCAGTSCNCCPGANMKCEVLGSDTLPSCVQCTADADCPGQRCDTINGRCVDAVAPCNTSDQCGPNCVRCPAERPLCLNGQVCVECRSDLDCGDGNYCISGQCAPCTTDRHCGSRCAACAGDTPLCLSTDGTTLHSSCVRCLTDGDCVGGTCQMSSYTCSDSCPMSCAAGTWCNGQACVACYASAHCPCGGSCDRASSTCTPACNDSNDCGADEHCLDLDHTCQPGRQQPDVGGGCDCLSSVGGRSLCDAPVGQTALAALFTCALLLAVALKRPRGRSR